MSKPMEWQAVWDGKPYAFSLERRFGKPMLLTVNGTQTIEIPMKPSFWNFEAPVEIDGKQARLVLITGFTKSRADLVVNGRYLSTGAEYRPMPKWVWAFLVPLAPLVVAGGALGAMIGVLGFWFCTSVAKGRRGVALRVLSCLGIAALAWVAFFIVAGIFQGLIQG